MSVSMYHFCIPTLTRMLNNISRIIDKAAAHCAAHKLDPQVVINSRLAVDMFPFSRQIQIMTDQAKGIGARLAGVENPSYADAEVTFDDLKTRIAKTIAFLETLKPEQFIGAEDRDITLKAGGNELRFKGLQYVSNFGFPNFFFHATTAYDILRHLGFDLSKRDFNGPH